MSTIQAIAASAPTKSPDRIERLPEAEAGASQVGRCKICDERIARGIAHALLPDAINKPSCKHPARRCGQCEDPFGKRCQSIAESRHRQS
jgi:hypothetical protein